MCLSVFVYFFILFALCNYSIVSFMCLSMSIYDAFVHFLLIIVLEYPPFENAFIVFPYPPLSLTLSHSLSLSLTLSHSLSLSLTLSHSLSLSLTLSHSLTLSLSLSLTVLILTSLIVTVTGGWMKEKMVSHSAWQLLQ